MIPERFFSPFEVKRNVISSIMVDGQNIIEPWGVEFADRSSFFSLEEGTGWRCRILDFQEKMEEDRHHVVLTTRLTRGMVKMDLQEWREEKGRAIRRNLTLLFLEDSELFDFVMRFRFKASVFHEGYIAGRILPYLGTNIYHQHPVNHAGVGNALYSLWVEVLEYACPKFLGPVMYLRDTEGTWILHARMIPSRWEREVVRLCSALFQTRPLPGWISSLLLRRSGIRNALWLRGERKPYRNPLAAIFSPAAYPLVSISKGELLRWDVRLALSNPREVFLYAGKRNENPIIATEHLGEP